MASNQELWLKAFARNLYETNPWYSFGKAYNEAVEHSKYHIPQATAGTTPIAITGTTLLPISATETTFDDLEVLMEMIIAPPKFVSNINMSEASFNTRQELLTEMTDFLKQARQINIADKWTTVETGSVIRTSGTATRENVYGKTTNAITFSDIMKAMVKLKTNTKNVNLDALYLVVDPVIESDIVQLTQFTHADELAKKVAIDGYIGNVGGFKIVSRAVGCPFLGADTGTTMTKGTVDFNDDHDSTHFSGALAIAGGYATYATGTKENGEIMIKVDPYATGYYTDIVQAHLRVGASPMYKAVSNVVKGFVSIIESA